MVDSKFFGIPFAVSGDKATIPEDTQPSGAISYQQGYGPDYERDPETDPLAKRVPRDETNELYYQITNAMRFLQLYGTPEWYAVDDNGGPVSYPLSARVRHDAGAGMQAWRSLIASNTTTPGANPAHWTLDEPFSFTALEASLAEALAGTSALKLITPRRLASSVQRGAWNYVTVAGTANALTATLVPALGVLAAGLVVNLKIANANTNAVTLNVNGLGAVPVVSNQGAALNAGDFQAGDVVTLTYDGTNFIWPGRQRGQLLAIRTFTTPGATAYTPTPGTRSILVEVQGGGGGGGGTVSTSSGSFASAGAGGAAGGYACSYLTSGFLGQTITVGAGGSAAINSAGGAGGASSFGALLSATGGAGGTVGGNTAVTGTTQAIGGAVGGLGTNGNVVNEQGGLGRYALLALSPLSGDGGASHFGAGAYYRSGTNAGIAGPSIGSGGSGACSTSANPVGLSGGVGAGGGVIITEFS